LVEGSGGIDGLGHRESGWKNGASTDERAAQGGGFEEQIVGSGESGGAGRSGGRGLIVGIAEAGGAEKSEPVEDEVADFRSVFDAVKLRGVQRLVIFFVGFTAAPAGGSASMTVFSSQ
jgi:hypothetical protein